MHKTGEQLNLSACDLVGCLNCRYLTELDLAVAHGRLGKPRVWDLVLEMLAERGALHERGCHLEENGLKTTTIDGVGVARFLLGLC